MKLISFVLISLAGSLCVVPSFGGSVPGKIDKMDRMPDLVTLCKKECPEAKSNEEVDSCLQSNEQVSGAEEHLKKTDSHCFDAHQRYLAMSGKINPPEPFRYG